MSTPDPRIETIFHEALNRAPAEREAFVAKECEGDESLQEEVRRLLAAHEDACAYFEPPNSAEIEAELARFKPEVAGEMVGPYTLREQIGEGGFGTVWVADQERPVRRRVALKIIKLGMDTKEVIARFEQERQALAMMDHPNIAKVLDAGATQWGRPYFVMELVRGIKITDYCDQENLPTAQRLAVFVQVCQAVQHAHQKGIIHRDLKPSNILVTLHDGVPVPKVIDFGVAKATQQQRLSDLTIYTQFQQMIGTPLYMSPEQAEMSGLDIDTRTDIYALGVLLYELLIGRTPFDPEMLMKAGQDEIRRVIREEEPPKPSTALQTMAADARASVAQHRQSDGSKMARLLSGELDWIVMKALEKDRTRRYETANGFADDIRRHLANEPVLARPPSLSYRLGKLVRRNKLVFGAAGAVAVALLAGLVGFANEWRRAERAERTLRARLAHEHVRAGLRMAGNQDALRGLPHYVEALRLGLGDPARERVVRLRFELTVRQAPKLTQLWLPETKGDMRFAQETGRVVVTSGPKTRVWDAATGTAVSPPIHHDPKLLNLWTDARGTRIVTEPHNDQITVWDSATGTAIATLPGKGHTRAVLGGPRLRLAAFQREAGTVTCISALDGAVDAIFSPKEKIGWAVASPDGTRVLAASDHSLFLWDVASRELVVPPVDFDEPDFGNFDPSGGLAGLRAKREGGIAVFDLATGTIAARGETKTTAPICHGWLDAARWVVLIRTASGSILRDGATDRLFFDAPLGARTVVADFATQRNVFALAGENGAAQLWDVDTAQPLTPRLWGDGRPDRLALSPDGATFLMSSNEPAVRLWKVPTPGGIAWKADRKVPALAVWWDAAGTVLRTVYEDARLTARDATTGQALRGSRLLDDAATCAAPNASGRLVFLGGMHGARLWNAESGEPAGPLIPCASAIRDMALSADGRRAAVLFEKETLICDPATGAIQHTLATDGALHCQLGADGTRLVTITDDAVQLWDAISGARIGEPFVEGGEWRDVHARFDATGRRLAVWWSWPDTLAGDVRVIESASGREILPRLRHSAAVKQAAFSAAGDLLVTGARDQRLRVWRMSDAQLAFAPILHGDRISDVGFSRDGLLVWSRSGREFHVWETATGDAASVLRLRGQKPPKPKSQRGSPTSDDEMLSTIWSTTGRVASCDSRGGVSVWDFSTPPRPLDEMESLARLLSMHRIESGGGLVPLTREELRAAWAAVHR